MQCDTSAGQRCLYTLLITCTISLYSAAYAIAVLYARGPTLLEPPVPCPFLTCPALTCSALTCHDLT
jgi:hypothetical protein